jgi:hypothetical protein
MEVPPIEESLKLAALTFPSPEKSGDPIATNLLRELGIPQVSSTMTELSAGGK